MYFFNTLIYEKINVNKLSLFEIESKINTRQMKLNVFLNRRPTGGKKCPTGIDIKQLGTVSSLYVLGRALSTFYFYYNWYLSKMTDFHHEGVQKFIYYEDYSSFSIPDQYENTPKNVYKLKNTRDICRPEE